MSHGIAAGPPPVPPRRARGRHADGPVCPECGAKRITSAQAQCWMCGAILPALESPVPGGPMEGPVSKPVFIALGVLILLVMVGLATAAPGLLVVFALAATPALIRAVVVSRKSSGAGRPLEAGEKVGAFLGALGATVLVGAAAFVAFFATCFAVCWGLFATSGDSGGGGILVVSVLAGLVPGIIVLVWLLRWILGKSRKHE